MIKNGFHKTSILSKWEGSPRRKCKTTAKKYYAKQKRCNKKYIDDLKGRLSFLTRFSSARQGRRQWRGGQRSFGIRQSRGQVWIRVDADAIFFPHQDYQLGSVSDAASEKPHNNDKRRFYRSHVAAH